MIKNMNIKLFSCVFAVLSCLQVETLAMKEDNELNRPYIKNILEKHIKENPNLLNSSKEKDIVVFLGKTGAGKSTLINFLSGTELNVNENGDIILKDPSNLRAMKIGTGSQSETFLPKFVQCNNLLFYDFPGFGDTRGTGISLINACFIKNIIENAKTARLVFVAGVDEVTAEKGKLFKELINITKNLIPNEKIEDFSSLIITKTFPGVNKNNVILNLEKKTDSGVLTPWVKKERLNKMSAPSVENKKIDQNDKGDIVKTILTTANKKIKYINIDVIYNKNEESNLKKIYQEEMEEIVDIFIKEKFKFNLFPSLNIEVLENSKKYLQNSFLNDAVISINKSSLITLLRPISENIYTNSWNEIKKNLLLKGEKIEGLINIEIKEKHNKKLEQEKKEQENKRIQEENRRKQLEEQLRQAEVYRKEQENKRIQEENRRKQLEEQLRQEEIYRKEQELKKNQEMLFDKKWLPLFCKLKKENIQEIKEIYEKKRTSVWLKEDTMLGNNEVKALCQMDQMDTITDLWIDYVNIGYEGTNALSQNRSITTLRMGNKSSQGMGDNGAKVFKDNVVLTSLSLNSDRSIKDEAAMALSQNPVLKHLSLAFCGIGDKGAKALSQNKSITQLSLWNNDIGDEGAKALSQNKYITRLTLGGHYKIGNEGAKSFRYNTTVTTLDLTHSNIGDEGAKALSQNTTLKELLLHTNKISDEGAKAFKDNKTLTALDLHNNNIGDEGAMALAQNTTLTSLSLYENKISDLGAKAFLKNTNLTSLDLTSNKINQEIITLISQMLEKNRNRKK